MNTKSKVEAEAWTDVSAHSRLKTFGYGHGYFYQPPDDGRIFRHHYTEAPDPFSIMPKKLIEWLKKEK